MTAFVVGFLTGGTVGILLMAAVAAGARSDQARELADCEERVRNLAESPAIADPTSTATAKDWEAVFANGNYDERVWRALLRDRGRGLAQPERPSGDAA